MYRDTEGGHCQGACCPQRFFYIPVNVSETALPFTWSCEPPEIHSTVSKVEGQEINLHKSFPRMMGIYGRSSFFFSPNFLSCLKKYSLWWALLTMALVLAFQLKSLEIVLPSCPQSRYADHQYIRDPWEIYSCKHLCIVSLALVGFEVKVVVLTPQRQTSAWPL